MESKILDVVSEVAKNFPAFFADEFLPKCSPIRHESFWKIVESEIVEQIKEALYKNIVGVHFETPTSKSNYPDLKVFINNSRYAIDIKTNDSKEPWFDIARADTYEEKRYKVYDEAFEFIVKYVNTHNIDKCYFVKEHDAAGYNSAEDIIKVRPYDIKIRPKSWNDFENNKSYYNSREDFLSKINKTIVHVHSKRILEMGNTLREAVIEKLLEGKVEK